MDEIYYTLIRRNFIKIYQVANDIFIIADDPTTAYYILHTSDNDNGLKLSEVNDMITIQIIIDKIIENKWTLEKVFNGIILRVDLSSYLEKLRI